MVTKNTDEKENKGFFSPRQDRLDRAEKCCIKVNCKKKARI